jgi:hypothetical protein
MPRANVKLVVMTIFAVISVSDNAKLVTALEANFPGDYIKVGSTEYFVAAPPKSVATAKDLSDKLGITDGTNGIGIVLNTAGYYGRAAPNIWEWLTAKVQQVE